MIYRVEYLKDVVGNNYLGVNIYVDFIQQYLEKLKAIIGDEYAIYIKNQQNRDSGHYHITVINVMEYNKLSNEIGMDKFINSLDAVFDFEFDDLQFLGIGTVEKAGNQAYFVVVRSEKLQEVRRKYGLPEQDFHITLGFKWKDVFGVRKNQVLKEKEPFLKLLKDLYYKGNETFDFIKEIENYEFDEEFQVEPIDFTETTATFRVNKNYYFSISLIYDKLRISASWQDSEKRPILSNTLISKKLKDI
jgi:hypothetical protein